MKRSLLLIFALFSLLTNVSARKFTVNVQDNVFSPASISNVHPGDTIMWVWVSGTHTTTSTSSIPAGAAPWDHTLNSTGSFIYVPTVLGVYNYQCTFHASMGMVGNFTVVSATGVPASISDPLVELFPNPAAGILNFRFTDPNTFAFVSLTDVCGRQAASINLIPLQNSTMNIQNIPDGLYFVKVIQGEMVMTKKITVSH